MSAVDLVSEQPRTEQESITKLDENKSSLTNSISTNLNDNQSKSQQHPLHQYDLSKMSTFYESCVAKLREQNPKWNPTEWVKATPMPQHLSAEEQKRWSNPVVFSDKQRVFEAFEKLSKDLGEPMILMPNFDLSDLQNFEMFLDSLKHDGVNAIKKYKQYLSNKDMRKQEIDLVAIHPRFGIILVEVKDSDYFDYKRKNRARSAISHARNIFKSFGRLIGESKGLTPSESSVPVMEFVALPNVRERPTSSSSQSQTLPTSGNHNQSVMSTSSSSGRSSRQLNYLIKSDLENSAEFAKWWSKNVVEPKAEQEKLSEETKKVSKFDWQLMNCLISLVNCVRNNSILPVVYPEAESSTPVFDAKKEEEKKPEESGEKKSSEEESSKPAEKSVEHFEPALNVHAEFFKPAHEEARALSKCLVASKDSEKIRKTICLQTLWLLLNDSQKKLSIVCSELNKPYYEEFFDRQRKIYGTLNNVRFFTNLNSCDVNGQHTLKRDGEVWFFDSLLNGSLSDVFERAKNLTSYWIFSEQTDLTPETKTKLSELNAYHVDLDRKTEKDLMMKETTSFKMPLRLQCDLLIIGDMISANQMKYLYKFLKNKSVVSQASHYQPNSNSNNNNHHHNHNQYQQYQQLNFNPAKKFRTVKFIRGGTIDNIRSSLKMHDSIQAPVVLMHVGDEDLFKTRNSLRTIERIKELSTLVKEYCPKSFVVLSTLMKRMSRTENLVANEVNKGMTTFCKQTRDSLNCFYMINSHFEPDYHTQGGRLLNNKGLKLYVDNVLFVVDHFLIRNNKQH